MPVESDLPESASQKLLWRHLSLPTQESAWVCGTQVYGKTKRRKNFVLVVYWNAFTRQTWRCSHDWIELLEAKSWFGNNHGGNTRSSLWYSTFEFREYHICEYHQIASICEEVCKMDRVALKELKLWTYQQFVKICLVIELTCCVIFFSYFRMLF